MKKFLKKHISLLWRAFKEGEIGLRTRLKQEKSKEKEVESGCTTKNDIGKHLTSK